MGTAQRIITLKELESLGQALQPLPGIQFNILKIPKDILRAFEPSQIGTIVGTLMDACIAQLAQILPENSLLGKIGRAKVAAGKRVNGRRHGRKESEGHDFNEDTNFGELKRIPSESLQRFLKKHGAAYAGKGTYPAPWAIEGGVSGADEDDEDA